MKPCGFHVPACLSAPALRAAGTGHAPSCLHLADKQQDMGARADAGRGWWRAPPRFAPFLQLPRIIVDSRGSPLLPLEAGPVGASWEGCLSWCLRWLVCVSRKVSGVRAASPPPLGLVFSTPSPGCVLPSRGRKTLLASRGPLAKSRILGAASAGLSRVALA